MKIDKILFCSSELFSPFWNIQSRIWKTKFGIEPVCLLYGSKEKCGISEEHGQVIECQFDPSLPDIIQLQFSKFFHTTTEPNTTWMTGDIDLIPLQTEYFMQGMESIPDDGYCHLNYSMCGQMWKMPPRAFFDRGSRLTGGFDLPGHYHCAKGSLFKEILFGEDSFQQVIRKVVDSNRYGMIGAFKDEQSIRGNYWVAEETYTSERLWNHFSKRSFSKFFVKDYDRSSRSMEGKYGGANGSICPTAWDGQNYIYDRNKVLSKHYVEVHCPLPFEKQEKSLISLLTLAGMI